MKKTLIALAALGMVAGAAQASNVTIYGKLQPSIDIVDSETAAGVSNGITNISNNSSRIGFKGSEDLGNGLKAIFKLESTFDMVDGAGMGGARDTYVGLAGDFGTVMIGNIDSAYKTSTGKYDSMSDSIGDYNNIMGMASANGDKRNEREKGTIKYVSPSFNGFKVMASYANENNGKGAAAAGATQAWALAASYDNGPLNVVASIVDEDAAIEAWKIGAKYKIADFTLKAIYEQVDPTGANNDNDNIYLGVDYAVNGNLDLMAMYAKADDSASGANNGADAYALGVNYKLSKRTSVQGIYANVDNDGTGTYFKMGDYSGNEISGLSVRLQHKF